MCQELIPPVLFGEANQCRCLAVTSLEVIAETCRRAGGCVDHPKAEPTIINDRCRCSHDRFRHNYDTADGSCSKPDCDCKAYAPVTVETVELPEPCVEHPSAPVIGGMCGNCTQYPADMAAAKASCAVLHQDAEGNTVSCPDEAPTEPPAQSVRDALKRISERVPLPPPEGPEYTPCVCCGHIEPDHEADGGPCRQEGCDCWEYRIERLCSEVEGCDGNCCAKLPPQPERRPPLSVAYSVAGGHAYEVSIPGDASVTALDGALIITHPDAQVLAITRVAPIKENP